MSCGELARLAEASGFIAWTPLDVSAIDVKPEVCAANGLGYDYGPGRVAFTGCFLP